MIWLVTLVLSAQTAAEHIASLSGLPSFDSAGPGAFNLDLAWGDNVEQPQKISLSLEKSKAVPRRIPVYGKKDGEPQQIDLANMKHTNFYQDLNTHAAVSLTSFEGEDYTMKGKFVHENEEYEIEPFHPDVHKRSLGAKQGNHIIKKRETPAARDAGFDYVLPVEGSPEYKKVMEVQERAKSRVKDYLSGKYDKKRAKRQSLPPTTYTVQIYMVVDEYLYEILEDSAGRVGWANVNDYILYYLGHIANEIDIRYRCIDTTGIAAIDNDWTMSTKLSYVYIATGPEPFTPTLTNDCGEPTLPAISGLNALRTWAAGRTEAADADAIMLMTGLNILSGSCNTIGVAYVGTVCGFSRVSLNELWNGALYAHELGHNLGAGHDSGACSAQYVMEPSLGVTSPSNRGNNWMFSDCSIIDFDTEIASLGSSNCLLNSGCYIDSWEDDHVPPLGVTLSLTEQCKLYFDDSYVYSGAGGICYALRCTNGGGPNSKGGALQYTPCGPNMWCYKEECVPVTAVSSPEPKSTTTPELTTTPNPCPNNRDKKKAKCNGRKVKCKKATVQDCMSCGKVRKRCCNRCRDLGAL